MIERELIESIEPSAEQRKAASSLYGLFMALLDQGFDETQALHLVTSILSTVVQDT